MQAKGKRQRALTTIISQKKIGDQSLLLAELKKRGLAADQATISRDLKELHVVKARGFYQIAKAQHAPFFVHKAISLPPNLIIVNTGPGQAQAVAFALDQLSLPEVYGTIAGDDTIFLAVPSGKHKNVINTINNLNSQMNGAIE